MHTSIKGVYRLFSGSRLPPPESENQGNIGLNSCRIRAVPYVPYTVGVVDVFSIEEGQSLQNEAFFNDPCINPSYRYPAPDPQNLLAEKHPILQRFEVSGVVCQCPRESVRY